MSSIISTIDGEDYSGSFLPPIRPEDPSSDDVPFVALLNPRSGNKMGAVFLQEAERFSAYKKRFFDAVHVATKSEVAEAFKLQLEQMKIEVKLKRQKSGHTSLRPRLICGGGDGTASFALYLFFKALRVGQGRMSWSDKEIMEFFPALVQMPLGTGNDLAGILGWGRTIDPVNHGAKVTDWIRSALSASSQVRPFDVWGITPLTDMKVCMLKGIDPEHPDQPLFQEPSVAVPFLCLLYFEMGYMAFVAAQVECNRTESRIENFKEYAKDAFSSLLGASRRNVNLTGTKIRVPESAERKSEDGSGWRNYFPPPHRESNGGEFTSVGFMNINSIAAGGFLANDPALTGDGRIDFFRQKKYVKNILRRGPRFRTEKHERARFHIPATLPGVFCQYDGEARFVFHPDLPGHIDFEWRRVMQIPVVLGPEACRDITQERMIWDEPFFRFMGRPDEITAFRARLDRWLVGDLRCELNATEAQVAELQERSDKFAKGMCRRRARIYYDFGTSFTVNVCANCGAVVANRGCKGCGKRFCLECFQEHLGNTPNVQWMYADAGYIQALAKANFMRWSSRLCLEDAIDEMNALESERQILVHLLFGDEAIEDFEGDDGSPPSPDAEDENSRAMVFDNSESAAEWLEEFAKHDSRLNDAAYLDYMDSDSDKESDVHSSPDLEDVQPHEASDRNPPAISGGVPLFPPTAVAQSQPIVMHNQTYYRSLNGIASNAYYASAPPVQLGRYANSAVYGSAASLQLGMAVTSSATPTAARHLVAGWPAATATRVQQWRGPVPQPVVRTPTPAHPPQMNPQALRAGPLAALPMNGYMRVAAPAYPRS